MAEMTHEETMNQLVQTNTQLEHFVQVNKELQKMIGVLSSEKASANVTINSFKEYAESLEKQISDMQKSNEAESDPKEPKKTRR